MISTRVLIVSLVAVVGVFALYNSTLSASNSSGFHFCFDTTTSYKKMKSKLPKGSIA